VGQAEAILPNDRLFISRVRHCGDGTIVDASTDTKIEAGDLIAVTGKREALVNLLGGKGGGDRPRVSEVEDAELLRVPATGVDVFVTSAQVDGKTLEELARMPFARGVFLNKITRGATATDIPVLPNTVINRGDILTLTGRTQDIAVAT